MLSPHLITFIKCVREAQAGSKEPFSEKLEEDYGGTTPTLVQGQHFPTLLRPLFGGRDFTWVAPAFDAFVGNQVVRSGNWNLGEEILLTSLIEPGSHVIDA
eukprot:4473898-Amphidinium_carterae.1